MLSGFDRGMSWKDEMAVCMSAHDGQERGEEDEGVSNADPKGRQEKNWNHWFSFNTFTKTERVPTPEGGFAYRPASELSFLHPPASSV